MKKHWDTYMTEASHDRRAPLPKFEEEEEEPRLHHRDILKLIEMPEIKSTITRSKDGDWVISKVTLTTIHHKNYYKAILGAPPKPRKHDW